MFVVLWVHCDFHLHNVVLGTGRKEDGNGKREDGKMIIGNGWDLQYVGRGA